MIQDLFFIIPAILYLPVVFTLKYIVDSQSEDTKKYLNITLEPYNSIWDLILSIFSGFGTYYCAKNLYNNGFTCNITNDSLWIEYFVISKIPELLDTIFIVLRSKPLIFLQYYHHLITLSLSWLGFKIFPKEIIISALMNYFVHTWMYGYYFIYSIGYKGIRKYGYFITFFQTLQMIVAVGFIVMSDNVGCTESDIDPNYIFRLSAVIYVSYIYLFGKLLLSSLKKTMKKKE